MYKTSLMVKVEPLAPSCHPTLTAVAPDTPAVSEKERIVVKNGGLSRCCMTWSEVVVLTLVRRFLLNIVLRMAGMGRMEAARISREDQTMSTMISRRVSVPVEHSRCLLRGTRSALPPALALLPGIVIGSAIVLDVQLVQRPEGARSILYRKTGQRLVSRWYAQRSSLDPMAAATMAPIDRLLLFEHPESLFGILIEQIYVSEHFITPALEYESASRLTTRLGMNSSNQS